MRDASVASAAVGVPTIEPAAVTAAVDAVAPVATLFASTTACGRAVAMIADVSFIVVVGANVDGAVVVVVGAVVVEMFVATNVVDFVVDVVAFVVAVVVVAVVVVVVIVVGVTAVVFDADAVVDELALAVLSRVRADSDAVADGVRAVAV